MITEKLNIQKLVDEACLIDDFFMKFCLQRHPDVAQLMLQIILDDDTIQIVKHRFQDHQEQLFAKSVIMEMSTTLKSRKGMKAPI